MSKNKMKVCAVVPAYRVSRHLYQVVMGLFPYVDHICVVDDACPEQSGKTLGNSLGFDAARVTVITLPQNLGVGGAVIEGYRWATDRGFEVLVKVDGDDQMDPSYIPRLIAPILSLEADYTKGNRFFDPEMLRNMPIARLIGNAGLSFLSKISSGYWHVMDPTNGFTAIHSSILPWLHLEKVDQRYFFESDLLFRLGLIDAVVQDVPMAARYAEEVSQLKISQAFFEFSWKHCARTMKRIFYTHFLRSFSLGSTFLLASIPMIGFGIGFGGWAWFKALQSGTLTSTGTIMLAVMPTLLGVQLLLSFLSLDMSRSPSLPFSVRMDLIAHQRTRTSEAKLQIEPPDSD
jgi:dolichol-phosphate mannosyltransferase